MATGHESNPVQIINSNPQTTTYIPTSSAPYEPLRISRPGVDSIQHISVPRPSTNAGVRTVRYSMGPSYGAPRVHTEVISTRNYEVQGTTEKPTFHLQNSNPSPSTTIGNYSRRISQTYGSHGDSNRVISYQHPAGLPTINEIPSFQGTNHVASQPLGLHSSSQRILSLKTTTQPIQHQTITRFANPSKEVFPPAQPSNPLPQEPVSESKRYIRPQRNTETYKPISDFNSLFGQEAPKTANPPKIESHQVNLLPPTEEPTSTQQKTCQEKINNTSKEQKDQKDQKEQQESPTNISEVFPIDPANF